MKAKNVFEGIKDVLKPKGVEQIHKDLLNLAPHALMKKSVDIGFAKGIKIAIERGAEIYTIFLVNRLMNGDVESIKELVKGELAGAIDKSYQSLQILNAKYYTARDFLNKTIRSVKNGVQKKATLEELEEIKKIFDNAKIK